MEVIVLGFLATNMYTIIGGAGALVIGNGIGNKIVKKYRNTNVVKKHKVRKMLKYLKNNLNKKDMKTIYEYIVAYVKANDIKERDIHRIKMTLKKHLNRKITYTDSYFFRNIFSIARDEYSLEEYFEKKDCVVELMRYVCSFCLFGSCELSSSAINNVMKLIGDKKLSEIRKLTGDVKFKLKTQICDNIEGEMVIDEIRSKVINLLTSDVVHDDIMLRLELLKQFGYKNLQLVDFRTSVTCIDVEKQGYESIDVEKSVSQQSGIN
jgi:hypothetical protein